MDKEKILSVMGHVDPGLIEEADMAVSRSHRAWKKPALIAACLCLVLAGTVGAIELAKVTVGDVFIGKRQEDQQVEYGAYSYSASLAAVPVSSLSELLLSDTAACVESTGGEVVDLFGDPAYMCHTFSKEFDSWEKAEEYLGIDIADNSLLAGAEPLMPTPDQGGYCNIWVSARGNEGEAAYSLPSDVQMIASYLVEYGDSEGIMKDCKVNLRAMVMTETYPHDRESAPFHYSYGYEVDAIDQETYVNSSGLEAAIVSVVSGGRTEYQAYCVINGVLLCIDTVGGGETVIRQVLDGFN